MPVLLSARRTLAAATLAFACTALPAAAVAPTRALHDALQAPVSVALLRALEAPGVPALQVRSVKDDGDDDRPAKRRPRIVVDDEGVSLGDISEKAPWIIGVIFMSVAMFFLIPIVLLVGIIWYKLRKARLHNEAMVALATRGVIAPSQAAEAIVTGEPVPGVGPGTAAAAPQSAPTVYQQAAVTRRRMVWKDLRNGVIALAVGLAFTFHAIVDERSASWLGLLLIFVGLAYITLWYLEERNIDRPPGGPTS